MRRAREDNRVEGDFSARSRRFSAYTWMETHPRFRAVAAGLVAGSAVLLARRGRKAA